MKKDKEKEYNEIIGKLFDEVYPLTRAQLENGRNWLFIHWEHVKKLLDEATDCEGYPPFLEEDKNNPALWKPNHWRWFTKDFK